MTDEVQADTSDLRAFVSGGETYQTRLEGILDTVRFRRATVVAAVDETVGVDSISPFEELLAETTISNRFVDTVRLALDTHQFTGTVKTVRSYRIDTALAGAGLQVTGDDLSGAEDQRLAGREPTGPVGDDALRLLGGWMNEQDVHMLSARQLEAMVLIGSSPAAVGRSAVPPEVRRAAQYLYRNPDLFLRVAKMSGSPTGVGSGVSVDDLETTVIVNEGLRAVGDVEVFRAIDTNNDGRITYGEIASAEGALPPDVFEAVQGLNYAGRDPLRTIRLNNVPIIQLAAEAENQGLADGPGLTGTYEDGLSYTDVVGAAINQHAFATQPRSRRKTPFVDKSWSSPATCCWRPRNRAAPRTGSKRSQTSTGRTTAGEPRFRSDPGSSVVTRPSQPTR